MTMIIKRIIFLVLFGAVICKAPDFWMVTSSCSSYGCEVIQDNGPDCFGTKPPIAPSSCDKAVHYFPISVRQEDLPILSAEKTVCESYKTPQGTYYSWYNQTSDQKVTKWKCYDSGCMDCIEDETFASTSLPVSPCKSSRDYFTWITEGLPKIAQFYPKQRDPNQNWYRYHVYSKDCNPETADFIEFYPWRVYSSAVKVLAERTAGGDCYLITREYCRVERCTSQDTTSLYYYPTDVQGSNAVCEYSRGPIEKSVHLGNCEKCIKL